MQEDREPGIEHGYSQLRNTWLSICYQVPKNGYLSVIQTGVNNRDKGFFSFNLIAHAEYPSWIDIRRHRMLFMAT